MNYRRMVWSFVPDHTLSPKVQTASGMFDPEPCFLFSPPHPVKKFFYRCDRKFHLDDLLKLYETHEDYAIVLVSGKRCELYYHNINQTKLIKTLDIDLPNQHRTGGQSAQRFERIRDEKIKAYVTKICELMIQYYVLNGVFKCKGLIIAGPAEIKENVKEHELFTKFFSRYLLKTCTISEINLQSIHQVIQMSSEILSNRDTEQNEIDNFEKLILNPEKIDLIVFGETDVLNSFNEKQLETIYVNEKSNHKDFIIKENKNTNIIIIKNSTFSNKYGDLIGIRYYVPYLDVENDDNEDK